MDAEAWVDAVLDALDILVSWPTVALVAFFVLRRQIPSVAKFFGDWFKEWMRSRDIEAGRGGVRTVFVSAAAVVEEEQAQAAADGEAAEPEATVAEEIANLARAGFTADDGTGPNLANIPIWSFSGLGEQPAEVYLATEMDRHLALIAMVSAHMEKYRAATWADFRTAAELLRDEGKTVTVPPFHEDAFPVIRGANSMGPVTR